MKKGLFLTGVLGLALLAGALDCHAENWVRKNVGDKTVQSNWIDGDSVKAKDKTISWTEKYVLTSDGVKHYDKHLATFKGCKEGMAKKGEVTQHQIDFEIQEGNYRRVAKRNYNKNNELVCTDKDMGNDLDKRWHRIGRRSPMEDTYYYLVTTYKLGNL